MRNFKNPIVPRDIDGFYVITADIDGFPIGESEEIVLTGVTEPTSLDYAVFSLVDTSIVGQYTDFRIEIGMANSLGPSCFIKIIFPDEIGLDYNLITTTATSFLRPSTGTQVDFFEEDLDTKTFAFEGCQRTWGADPSGALTFQRV